MTTDHSYTTLQVKLGLLLERNAMTSQHRSTLTRSVGGTDLSLRHQNGNPRAGRFDFALFGRTLRFVLDEEILEQ